jgi:hypothetical protein
VTGRIANRTELAHAEFMVLLARTWDIRCQCMIEIESRGRKKTEFSDLASKTRWTLRATHPGGFPYSHKRPVHSSEAHLKNFNLVAVREQ